ncbi:MAG: potassium channel family protein, partial [Candidatus Micrarchaeia archaeon]
MAVDESLEGHVIVCGYGLVGERVVDILLEHGVKVVVIEIDSSKVQALIERGVDVIKGDATSSKVLRDAGVERAKAIAIVMDDDAKNLFSIITAKDLNDKIIIATRANDEGMIERFKDAGAAFIATPAKSAS